jgi:hypothetical protein
VCDVKSDCYDGAKKLVSQLTCASCLRMADACAREGGGGENNRHPFITEIRLDAMREAAQKAGIVPPRARDEIPATRESKRPAHAPAKLDGLGRPIPSAPSPMTETEIEALYAAKFGGSSNA